MEHSITKIKENLSSMATNLYEKADSILKNNYHKVLSLEDAKNLKGIIELPWCGTDSCALEVEDLIEGNTLGEPVDKVESIENNTCPVCGKQAVSWMRYARSY